MMAHSPLRCVSHEKHTVTWEAFWHVSVLVHFRQLQPVELLNYIKRKLLLNIFSMSPNQPETQLDLPQVLQQSF